MEKLLGTDVQDITDTNGLTLVNLKLFSDLWLYSDLKKTVLDM